MKSRISTFITVAGPLGLDDPGSCDRFSLSLKQKNQNKLAGPPVNKRRRRLSCATEAGSERSEAGVQAFKAELAAWPTARAVYVPQSSHTMTVSAVEGSLSGKLAAVKIHGERDSKGREVWAPECFAKLDQGKHMVSFMLEH
eukprot:CAMPEP_0177628528 /NCGR_PEP_ID=MMETSP0447-20121125/179_1 /TAXON_ID=0 /ORGANISM="Stygamoeba regulata, Strain BSH-02190019" /LENGTH=141 /DNA_ID=CAMNT_0019129781 /DNA_START=377 /DNA_END=803 /DNA_ORIENTATION=+